MKLRDVLKAAVANLTRHKARTALTTVGVVVGILTIVTMVSLGIGVQREMKGAFASVGLETVRLFPTTDEVSDFSLFGEPERTKLLTPELVATLEARDGVAEVTPFLRMPNSVKMTARLGDQESQVYPWGPRPAYVRDPFETAPKLLAGQELPSGEGGSLVLGQGLLELLGLTEPELPALVGKEIELVLYAPRGDSQVFEFRIEGITDHDKSSVALSLPDRLAMLAWWYNDPDYLARRGYDEIAVLTESLNESAQLVDWLDGQGYEVRSLKTMLDMANKGMIIIQTMLGSVGGLALLVASIGIANTMIMAVYERTKEIGILKAVGAAPGQIRALFVVEASLIGLLGGIVGTVVGFVLGQFLNWLLLEILRWQEMPVQGTFFIVSWWLVVGALVFATLVGLLAGLYPAARAARLAPLDALRYE